MSSAPPTVSVCVPAHNAAAYLPMAVESVLGQEFEDFELIVSDDASVDATADVCRRYRADPRFRVVRSEERLGQSGNWNRCLELASGDYVILLHADDEILPRYLSRATEVLNANADVGFVHCAVDQIDEAGEQLRIQRLLDRDVVDRASVILRRLLLEGCVVNPAGVLVRRHLYEEAGRFTDRIVWGVDWHMWIRLALRNPVAYLAEPLARYRQHTHSGTTGVMRSGRNAQDETWVIEDAFGLIAQLRPELLELHHQAVQAVALRTFFHAEAMCELGDMAAARVGLRNAVRISPTLAYQPKVWGLWLATFAGYRWYRSAHTYKRRLGRRP